VKKSSFEGVGRRLICGKMDARAAKLRMIQSLKFVISHDVSNPEYYGPESALVEYLDDKKVANLIYIQNLYYKKFISDVKYIQGNELKCTKISLPFISNYLRTTFLRFVTTLYFVLSAKRRFDLRARNQMEAE